MTATTTAAPVTTRSAVGWGDLAWLTWRQHRWTLGGTAVALVGMAILALGMTWHTEATGTNRHEVLGLWSYEDVTQLLALVPIVLGALIAVFWAAPLVSREYEQRTHLVVWSQDVTAVRWLTGKVVLLGVPAVALAGGLGSALIALMNSMNGHATDYVAFRPFGTEAFEAAPQVQVGYAAFGFALGLVFSAMTRRTVLSMGLTLGFFFVVRGVVAGFWRPYYQTPIRVLEPLTTDDSGGYWDDHDRNAWTVNSGYADAAGDEVELPHVCLGQDGNASFLECLVDQGITQGFYDYQPANRAVTFQWFEFGVFAVSAAVLLGAAFLWVRRSHRV